MELVTHLDTWFSERLKTLRYDVIIQAYITSVLLKFKTSTDAFARDESVVLAFHDAKQSGSFVAYQRIGDWILFVDSFYPESIKSNQDVVESIGQLSYYACYRLLKRQWHVYERLADELPTIAKEIRNTLSVNL